MSKPFRRLAWRGWFWVALGVTFVAVTATAAPWWLGVVAVVGAWLLLRSSFDFRDGLTLRDMRDERGRR